MLAWGLWLPSHRKSGYPEGPGDLDCILSLGSKPSLQNAESIEPSVPTTMYLVYIQASQTKIFQKGLPPDLMCVCLVLGRTLLIPQVFFPNQNKICRDQWGQRQHVLADGMRAQGGVAGVSAGVQGW